MKEIDFGSFPMNNEELPHIATKKIPYKFIVKTNETPVDFWIFFKFSKPIKRKIYRHWDKNSIYAYLTLIGETRAEVYGKWDILGCRNLQTGEEYKFSDA